MTLVEFLRAMYAAEEQHARDLDGEEWRADTQVGDEYNIAVVVDRRGSPVARCGAEGLDGGELRARHIARHDPARVLRDVEAKRRILDSYVAEFGEDELNGDVGYSPEQWLARQTLRLLALPYADHPDYNPQWGVFVKEKTGG